jgi:hypothetical protein
MGDWVIEDRMDWIVVTLAAQIYFGTPLPIGISPREGRTFESSLVINSEMQNII